MPRPFIHEPRQVTPNDDNPAPLPEIEARREALWVHDVPENALLPPICPLCTAPGIHAQPVPQEKGCVNPVLHAYYCDLCAEAAQSAQTRRLAVTLASSLFSFALATALILFYGLRYWGAQLLIVLLFSASLPLLTAYLGVWRSERETATELASGEKTRRLATSSTQFSQALTALGWERQPLASRRVSWSALLTSSWPLWAVALAAVTWWSALHVWGSTQVRVIYGGSGAATLLVDGRHSGSLPASHSEDPLAGRRFRVLAGRKVLQLVSSRGELLLEKKTTLWPQHSYILALPPAGECLFLETRTYGGKGPSHFMNRLPGDGPLWEIEGTIDAWFEGLGEASEASSNQENFSGGKRRAIRLLPCRERLENNASP